MELTPTQKKVLALRLEGLCVKEIARSLNIAEMTAKVHTRAVFERVGSRRLPVLVRAAREAGLLTPDHPLTKAFVEPVQ